MIAILIPTAYWQIRLVSTGGDYEAGGSVQQAFLVGISKFLLWFPAEKKKKNKNKKCLIATRSVILLVQICKQNNVKVVMKLYSHWQLGLPHWYRVAQIAKRNPKHCIYWHVKWNHPWACVKDQLREWSNWRPTFKPFFCCFNHKSDSEHKMKIVKQKGTWGKIV